MRDKLFWWFLGIAGGCGLIICLTLGWMFLKDIQTADNVADAAPKEADMIEQILNEPKKEEAVPVSAEKIKPNPFGETIQQDDLTDKEFNKYIHGMSHQKVKAETKWGFYLLTDTRINWLLTGLGKVDLDRNEAAYRSILERWKNGDFSAVVNDHNEVWKLQGGNVGKATGVLTEQEERAYIQKEAPADS